MGRASSSELLRSASKIAILAAAAAFLTGCGGFASLSRAGSSEPGQMAASPRDITQPDSRDVIGAAAYWGAKYEANRNDMNAAVSFSRSLRVMGGAQQAVTVMKEVVMTHPDDASVLAEYGKALTSAGRSADAVPFLARAVQIDGNDWTTLSAYGVALDQTNAHQAARQNYDAALKLAPGNTTIETNLALSYLLEGRIAQAEPILRRLANRPDATPQMRQNLAMVEALTGNTTAAQKLAQTDLTPTDAQNNIAVLSQLSASNAAVDVQPLAAPKTTPAAQPESSLTESAPAQAPAAAPADVPAPAFTPRTMAPIADDDETPAAAPATTPAPVSKPTAEATPAPAATPAATTPAPAPQAAATSEASAPAPAPQPATRPPVTMAPIADDEDQVPAPAPKAPAPVANTATQPAPTAEAKPQTEEKHSSLRTTQDPFRSEREVSVATR